MPDLQLLNRLLQESGDRENPPPEVIREVLRGTRTIAVVGLSRDPAKDARRVPAYLATKGYEIIPVNPFADRILGRQAVATLSDVTSPVEMVLVFRPSDQAGTFLRDAVSRPERPVVWLAEGIEAGEDARAAREDGRTIIQDLCIFKAHRALEGGGPGATSGG